MIYFVLIFGKKFSCNQGIWALFYGDFVAVSAICVRARLKDSSCKTCNKFKLHFSSSLSEGKIQSSNYAWYLYVATVISSKVRSTNNAAQTRWIQLSFRTLPMLYWVTLVHLLVFLLFVILSVWLLLLLRMTFFYRIVEEEKKIMF